MAVTKFSSGSSFKNLTKYDDFLAGNTAYSPAAFESIATATGTGSSNAITFSSIPQTYTSLQIRIFGKDTRNSTQYSVDGYITLNSVTTYGQHYLRGDGTSASSSGGSNTVIILPNAIATSRSGMTSIGSAAIIDIHDYTNASRNKTVRAFGGVDTNGVGAYGVYLASGVSVNTAAVTSVTLTCDTAGSVNASNIRANCYTDFRICRCHCNFFFN